MKTRFFCGSFVTFCGILCVLSGCNPSTGPQNTFQVSYVHYRASWSPDGRTIAFIGTINNTFGIYAADSSGSNIRLVHAGDVGGPTWSPDSKWIAFSEMRNLFKIKITGDSLTQLTSSGQDIRPTWSRNGKTIAFERSGIWLLDVQKDTARNLSGFGSYSSWHPNGAEVVVLDPNNAPFYYFYAVRADSGNIRLLLSFTSSEEISFSSISPNGTEISFTVLPTTFIGYTQIWKVNMQSNQFIQLTNDGGDFAAWRSDGSKIVYTRTQYGDGGLWIMNADGSGKRRLTSP